MIPAKIFRLIHTNSQLWQSTNKSLLAQLRKNTGYSLSNCRKALDLHGNDLKKAEAWLREQAQTYGWTQASKLQGRDTSQGLIALSVDGHHAALAEINCETDFVAKNNTFQGLAETVVGALLNHAKTREIENGIQQIHFHSDGLKALPAADGKTLNDHSALVIGSVGENITLKRALTLSVKLPDVTLHGCTHPTNTVPMSFGKYGALLAVNWKNSDDKLAKQLCQHIIGMKPQKVGNFRLDMPYDNVDDEPCLIYQEFLFEAGESVQQILADANAEIVDFARFEIGEKLKEESEFKHIQT